MLSPLPTLEQLAQVQWNVIVSVQPKMRSASNVSRVVVFRGDKQIDSVESSLTSTEFHSAAGAHFQINAGSVEFPQAVFGPGPDLRVELISGVSPIEWKLSAADVARVR